MVPERLAVVERTQTPLQSQMQRYQHDDVDRVPTSAKTEGNR